MWMFEEDWMPMMVTWGFIGGIVVILGAMTWAKKNVAMTKSGIEHDS